MARTLRSRAADTPVGHKPASRTQRRKPASAATQKPALAATASSALVRVYRQGLGDCILIRLRKHDGSYYKILIDCGVAVATEDAKAKMTKVVQDVMETTEKEIDVLALTHQHWDHLSGFIQAEELFDEMKIGEIWVAWTEDPHDELAETLREEHGDALKALGFCVQKLALAGDSKSSQGILDILGVSGSANDTGAAFNKAKALAEKVQYCHPTDPPLKLDDPDVRIFVLGPPHDLKAIRQTLPSKAQPETYELALDGTGVIPCDVASALNAGDDNRAFSDTVTIPFEVAKGLPFFQNHYWGTSSSSEQWRRIDTDWLASSEELALALQSATNNTSLVLAIELPNKDVLLFAADAQVGNWLSWQGLNWDVDGEKVTGPDLLSRTVFYKVGHHGSMNATLKEKGVEEMKALHTAIIPVDHEVAVKMRWGNIPLDAIISALDARAKDRVFRTDKTAETSEDVNITDLYYEFAIN